MELLKQEQAIRQDIFRYFGYLEDWCVFPFDDATQYYWKVDAEERSVMFAKSQGNVITEEGECYANEIYRQRFLPKWVYRGPEYTMILVDTHCDGNKFLQIFDNAKEIREE